VAALSLHTQMRTINMHLQLLLMVIDLVTIFKRTLELPLGMNPSHMALIFEQIRELSIADCAGFLLRMMD
jgi:hypothetical protein